MPRRRAATPFLRGGPLLASVGRIPEEVYTPKNNTDDYKDDYMSRAHWVNALTGGSERMPDSAGLRIPVDMALAFHSDAGVRDGDGIVGTLGICYTRENKGKFQKGAPTATVRATSRISS